MKLHENVETETSEKGVFNSRASRMARYSAAAAGVAAVSTLDVDAAMIKVIVTDTDAQNTEYYELDLSAIVTDTTLHMSQYFSSSESVSAFIAQFTSGQEGSVAVSSSYGSSYLRSFSNGSTIRGPWAPIGGTSSTSGSSFLFGFGVNEGENNYTDGWFKVTFYGTSSFTLNSYGYNSTLNGAAIAGQGTVAGVPDSGPGIVGLALLGAGAAGVRLLRKLRSKS